MKRIIMFAMLVVLLSSCKYFIAKEEKPDFLKVPDVSAPVAKRIKIIEGNSLTTYQIVEVDGHQYLTNPSNGGFIHLESCPCKSK